MVFHTLENRGQVNIEFIVAVVLLAFVLISTIIFTIRLIPASSSALEEGSIRAKANALEDVLLYSPGYPPNWTSIPAVVGLAAFNNYSNETILGGLSAQKLLMLNTTAALNYSSVKRNLSLDENTDFYLKVNSSGWGSMEYFNYTPMDTQRVVSINKLMILYNQTNGTTKINQTEANVTLLVW
ncbi:TPA: hypothetical protein H1012_02880 [archaeon]|nr:hypothetical protein [Candidatus Naiadarchaeales archaeon SRR2090159.bin1288]